MGICNPTSRILTYKLDNEVGATLHVVEIDGGNYIQLVSKEGNILSQQPLPSLGGSVLSEDLTPNLTVGGLVAGVTIAKGSSIETLFRRMLYMPDWYVGFASGLSKTAAAALSDSDILQYVLGQYSGTSATSYDFTPQTEKGVFFILLRDDSDVEIGAKLTPKGMSGLATSWSFADITDSDSDWFLGAGGTAKKVSVGGYSYTMYGYYNNEWTTAANSSSGVSDLMTITVTKE